jgi:hypothetical protein
MFGQAGATVTTLGMHQAAWILQKIYKGGNSGYEFTTDYSKWPPPHDHKMLLCWEAFVSGGAHSKEHIRDATTATMFFLENENALEEVNAVTTEHSFSLIHSVALWVGWSTDLSGLHQMALVLKPSESYKGAIHNV